MNLTTAQKEAIRNKLLDFGEVYYETHAALVKGDMDKFMSFMSFMAVEVGVSRDFISFLESL